MGGVPAYCLAVAPSPWDNKRRPILTLAERVAVIESCRYVDEVIEDAPLQVTEELLGPAR